MQEKLKTEGETSARLRKQITEITLTKVASEQLVSELQSTLPTLQIQCDKLEQEVTSLQAALTQERTSHSRVSRLHAELEGNLNAVHSYKTVFLLKFFVSYFFIYRPYSFLSYGTGAFGFKRKKAC